MVLHVAILSLSWLTLQMSYFFWYIRQVVLTGIAAFFLYFGIGLFRAAYSLEDPFSFIMTVFASNLIILISAALLIGFVYRMYNMYKYKKNRSGSGGFIKGE